MFFDHRSVTKWCTSSSGTRVAWVNARWLGFAAQRALALAKLDPHKLDSPWLLGQMQAPRNPPNTAPCESHSDMLLNRFCVAAWRRESPRCKLLTTNACVAAGNPRAEGKSAKGEAVAVGLPQAGTKQKEVSYTDTQVSDKQRAMASDSVQENVEKGKDIEMKVRAMRARALDQLSCVARYLCCLCSARLRVCAPPAHETGRARARRRSRAALRSRSKVS
jgi:hypothetical protein